MSVFQDYNWSDKLILVVDDDQASLLLLEVMLAKTGAMIVVAENGERAIEVFLSTKGIDLILMDIKMDGLNGFEATRIIRRIDSKIPIIAQTACVISGDRENCLRSGCTDYISKPIVAEELILVLNKYISKNSTLQPVTELLAEG